MLNQNLRSQISEEMPFRIKREIRLGEFDPVTQRFTWLELGRYFPRLLFRRQRSSGFDLGHHVLPIFLKKRRIL
jgi:hypothetical protein